MKLSHEVQRGLTNVCCTSLFFNFFYIMRTGLVKVGERSQVHPLSTFCEAETERRSPQPAARSAPSTVSLAGASAIFFGHFGWPRVHAAGKRSRQRAARWAINSIGYFCQLIPFAKRNMIRIVAPILTGGSR